MPKNRRNFNLIFSYLFKLCIFFSFSFAAAQITPSQQLDTITIASTPIPKPINELSENIIAINQQDLAQTNGLDYYKILNRNPGIFMQSGTQSTNRITIRGIGARSPFSTVGIRAYLGDIPLTDGNAASAIENFELTSLASVQILKGPAASNFGVGLGGTILLQPLFPSHNSLGYQTSVGSFGLRRNILNVNFYDTKLQSQLVYSNSYSDGFRENNQYNRNAISLNLKYYFNANNELELLTNYTDLKAFIPSSLSLTNFLNNPSDAAFTWGAAQGFEDNQNWLTGIIWRHKYNERYAQKTTVFSIFNTNYEPRPFNILAEESAILGARSQLLYKNEALEWAFGGEIFYDQSNNRFFENLYEAFETGTGSVQGDQFSGFAQKRYYYNFFAQANYQLNPKWNLNAGINLNQTFFRVTNAFSDTPINNNGAFDFQPIVSPKIGTVFKLNKRSQLFANIAHGFTPPTSEETLLPDNSFNPELKPETGWNFEIGQRYQSKNQKLALNSALFLLAVDNLLVIRRTANDDLFAINAGKTRHLGLEFSGSYHVVRKNDFGLQINGNATINHFRFTDFVTNSENFSDNKLTGVPAHVFNFIISGNAFSYFYGSVQLQHVGEIPVNDANTEFAAAYTTLDAQLQFKYPLTEKLQMELNVGAQNITDTSYASQIQVNAVGFGDAAPRFYYPATPINFYGGVKLNYIFN